MDPGIFLRGLLIGLSIAAPVGPIGVLCIRRTLADGKAAGFASGLGAATADAVYGFVAGFGLTFVSSFLVSQSTWLRLLGGLFLLFLGLRTFVSVPNPIAHVGEKADTGLVSAYLSTLVLTLTNPTTILSFAVVFAGLGLATGTGDYMAAILLVLGVFFGSALWWLLLSGGIGLVRERFSLRGMLWVNRVSGTLIMAFGVLALASLIV